MVYTYSNNQDQIEAIANTWAQKCDGFFASSNVEQRELAILNLHHEGEESYDNLWQKVRTMLFYAYENFIDSYDYFHM
jgi:glycoprotein-N-acetylgalactosamine 3-beta-galactosyltransferase